MKEKLTKDLKKFAKERGADLIGIASMDRFDGAPKEMDPSYIFPEAKSVVVLGFRILRGCFRGIEEGTYFNAYPVMGYGYINILFAPWVLWQVSKFIEDKGWEAVPVQNMHIMSDFDLDTGIPLKQPQSRPVAPGKPAPDVMLHFRLAAFAAGLGEIGYSKVFLTPEFGPRQRFVAIITDAPLEPDPLYNGSPLCDKCMRCVATCPANAISKKETVKVKIGDKEIEWGKLDVAKCTLGYQAMVREYNPFLPERYPSFEEVVKEVNEGKRTSRQVASEDNPYRPGYFTHHPASIGGAAGCIRACMMHLEKRGVIKNTFRNPFRKKKAWILRQGRKAK